MAKRGRPRLSEHPTERIDLRLPAPLYDALCREAARRGDDVRVLARRILTVGISAVTNRRASPPP
jgi:hypothetical protein